MNTLPAPALHAPARPTSPMGINALSPSSDAVFVTTAKKGVFDHAGSPLAVSPIGTPVGLISPQPATQGGFLSSSPTVSYPKSPVGSSRPLKRSPNEFPFEQQERPSWGSMGNLPPLFGHPLPTDGTPSGGFPAADASSTPSLPYLGIGTINTAQTGPNSARESYRPPVSPTFSSRPSALPVSMIPSTTTNIEVDYAPKAGFAAGTGAVAGKGSVVGAPSSPAPMMKPAPLQRAGSAGGVLMHPSRRPPPGPGTAMTSSPDPALWGIPVPTASSTNGLAANSMNNIQLNGAHFQDQEASEEWFDQFGGIEMESAPVFSSLSNVSLNTTPYGPPYDAVGETIFERNTDSPNSRMMNARYMPNQRANFALPQPQGFASNDPQYPRVSSLTSVPTFLQHPLGSSPHANPILGNNTQLPGSPVSYSTVKHSSRILMIHNFDQLNTDMNTLRSLCSSHGVVRSVAPFPESNAILISFFDLRHAQKAMTSLNSKVLPSGAMMEIQYHFLRDTGVMSKDANQGTLVIFNLDPAITNAEIMELFGKHGEIKEIRESPNRKHKFVEFYDVRCAEKAIKALNKTDLHGRKIKIEPSRPGGTSKVEPMPGRRGSVGSTSLFGGNVPMYNTSPLLSNHAFTHSTPTLPTMSAASGFMNTGQTTPTSFASFSPAVAPLLSVPNPMPYHTHSPVPSSAALRYFDNGVTDDHGMFSPVSVDPSFPTPLNPSMLSGAIGSNLMMNSRRQSASTPEIPSMTMLGMDENGFRFDRSFLEPHVHSTSQLYSDADSVYSDASSTASLFGVAANFNALSENSALNLDPTQTLSPHSDGVPGSLLSPITTPRSSGGSSSSSSADYGVLEASALHQEDIDGSLSASTPFSSASSQLNGNSSEGGSHQLKFDIIISQVLGGSDIRTTLMIKNIPNKYDQDMLLLAVNRRHQGTYDFFYLPIDFKNRCNVGYAFINFIDPKSIPAFCEEFDNKKWEKFNSEKVCRISYARIQGKLAMIEHFKNSSLMFEDPKCRPLIFHSDGTSVGKPEPFPIGPNVRPRTRKESAGAASATAPIANPSPVPSSSSTPTPAASPTRAYKPKKEKSLGSPAPTRMHHE